MEKLCLKHLAILYCSHGKFGLQFVSDLYEEDTDLEL